MEKVYLEDYSVGEKFVSPARTVTETDIVLYTAFTGNWHPLYNDAEYAKKSIFGERIVPDLYAFSLGICLLLRVGAYQHMPKKLIAFYGFDYINFIKPVKIGDTIYSQVEVKEIKPKDDKRGLIVYEHQTLNQRNEVVNSSVHRALVERKP
ncbi:MAG: MaoC/PaaZ C-terminal domain-containing protein [Chloroflexota bacterium]